MVETECYLQIVSNTNKCLTLLSLGDPGNRRGGRLLFLFLRARRLRGELFNSTTFLRKEREGEVEGKKGGEPGRRGNGLATNCTITTFRKRKSHSVLFLRTIRFPLLPPTWQFRAELERPLLAGPHSWWVAGRHRTPWPRLETPEAGRGGVELYFHPPDSDPSA